MSESANEEDVMKDIAEPRETDVLCGRGGAALRHAGNQTYRRLVNLNKGLYITCMKTEKLKISRSIVAAIREQKGRFLERDAKKGVWFDIGDKKAVEKTSQALREGQPKLRKKMVEMGQIPPEQANGGMDPVPPSVQQQLMHQYGNGIYNARAPQSNASNSLNGSMNGSMNMLMNSGMSMGSLSRLGSIGSGSGLGRLESIGSGNMGRMESMNSGNMGRLESIGSGGNMGRMESMNSGNMGRLESIGSGGNMGHMESMGSAGMGRLESIGSGGSMGSRTSYMLESMQQEQQQKQMMMGRNNTGRLRNNMSQMPPPPTRTFSNGGNGMNNSMGGNDLTMLQHLSLNSTPQSIPSWTPSMGSMESMMTMSTTDVPQMVSRRNLSRQYNRNQTYGSNNNNNIRDNMNNMNNMNNNMNNMQSMASNTSNNNDISDFGSMNGNGRGNSMEPNKFLTEKIGSFDPTEQPYRQQQQQQQQQQPPRTRELSPTRFNENNNTNNENSNEQRSNGPSISDRRRIFARMKRANSPRMMTSQRSIDGMPDIHMVDSQFSLLSNLSAHGSRHSKHRGGTDMDISKHGLTKKDSIGSEYIGVGSRRSLMSGMSKLSGHSSDINNTFAGMSKKFTGTNHTLSSRSLTMSEFSGVDEDDDFAEDEFSFDIPTRNP